MTGNGAMAAAQALGAQSDYPSPCNCTGPRPGEPVCPCQMRGVQIVNGRYVRTQDLGPAPASGMRRLKAPCVSFGDPLKEANTRVRCAVTGQDLGSAD